jgi:hypothetical protein
MVTVTLRVCCGLSVNCDGDTVAPASVPPGAAISCEHVSLRLALETVTLNTASVSCVASSTNV